MFFRSPFTAITTGSFMGLGIFLLLFGFAWQLFYPTTALRTSAVPIAQSNARVASTAQSVSFQCVAVVADDEPAQLALTHAALTTALSAIGCNPIIYSAFDLSSLVAYATTGKNRGPVDFVVLDGYYTLSGNVYAWLLPGDDEMTGDAFTISALLRARGYTGPVLVVSGGPSDFMDKPGSDIFMKVFKKSLFQTDPRAFAFKEVFS